MKFRTDFVTNSSSSSFIVAAKDNPTLSNKSKEALAQLLLKFALYGVGDPDYIIEKDEDYYNYYSKNKEEIENAKAKGKTAYECRVSYDDVENSVAELVEKVLKILEKEPDYAVITDDLSY